MIRETAVRQIEDTQSESAKSALWFKIFAACEVLLMLGGAVLGLFVAPASLFVSRTENEAFGWIAVTVIALVTAALAVILIPLALFAARGIGRAKGYGKMCGAIAAVLAILQFPIGTALGAFLLWKLFGRKADEEVT